MVKRQFHLGTEWVYVKIYSGPQTLEKLLGGELLVLFEELYSQHVVDQFFFVRFSDDFHHLRVRFKIIDITKLSSIITRINEKLNSYIEQRLVWNLVYSTYNRELERYGAENIEDCEMLFCYSSYIVSGIIRYLSENGKERDRWMWAIKTLNVIFDDFGMSLKDRFNFLELVVNGYSEEYNLTKIAVKKLNDKYRSVSKDIEEAMKLNLADVVNIPDNLKTSHSLSISNILERNKQGCLQPSLGHLLQSIVHMHLNRLFHTKQRKNEFVICYLLNKLYKSLSARESAALTTSIC